jgi:hypothetical protein
VKHSDKLVTTSGLDIQTVGKQLAYTLRSETRWKNLPNNKTAGGVSASYVAGAVALGAKLEDRCVSRGATHARHLHLASSHVCLLLRSWKVRPGSKLVLNCGVITSKGDTAFGASHSCGRLPQTTTALLTCLSPRRRQPGGHHASPEG